MTQHDDKPATPAWFYRAGEARIFEDGKCPKGWVDSPAKVKAKPEKAE